MNSDDFDKLSDELKKKGIVTVPHAVWNFELSLKG